VAQVRILRNSGVFGKLVDLRVFVDGHCVTTLREGEQQLLQQVRGGAKVHVEMQNHVRSPQLVIPEGEIELECGSNWWLALDWLNLCYLPMLREHVFYIKMVAKQRQPTA
jgi:hypothetical protein